MNRTSTSVSVQAKRTTTYTRTTHSAPHTASRPTSHHPARSTGRAGTRVGHGSPAGSGTGYIANTGPAAPEPYREGNRHYVGDLCVAGKETCGFEDFVLTAPTAAPASPPPSAAPGKPGAPPRPAAPVVDVVAVAQQAATQVDLPAPSINVGPDPSDNEWDMLAVGMPVWFWSDEPGQVGSTVTSQGITVSLVAHRGSTTFDFGDGTSTTCRPGTPRPDSAPPMQPSPDCGHTWTTHGTYTVTATTAWGIEWHALGQAGLVTMQRTATRDVEVGQLASVVVR